MGEFVAAWLPFIVMLAVFIGIGFWISRKQMSSYSRHVDRVQDINDQILAINREAIAELREIKQILKDRT